MKTTSEISEANFILDHFSQVHRCDGSLVTVMCPYTQLHLGKTRSIAVTGPHFFVLESQYVLLPNLSRRMMLHAGPGFRTGKLEGSTANFDEEDAAELLKSGPIHFSVVDEEFEHMITVGEDKKLKVWGLDELKLRSQRSSLRPLHLATDVDLYTTSQGSPETADFIVPRKGRSYDHRL